MKQDVGSAVCKELDSLAPRKDGVESRKEGPLRKLVRCKESRRQATTCTTMPFSHLENALSLFSLELQQELQQEADSEVQYREKSLKKSYYRL